MVMREEMQNRQKRISKERLQGYRHFEHHTIPTATTNGGLFFAFLQGREGQETQLKWEKERWRDREGKQGSATGRAQRGGAICCTI